MAVGRISGPLLKQNLLREGVDLAFETDLLYLDVNNQRIGINTVNPQYDLDINGTTRAPNLEVTNIAQIGDVVISGNTIRSESSILALGTMDNVVYQNKLRIDSIDIEGNRISSNDSNANIELSPNGTGRVEIHSDMNVTGDVYVTGNITADGTITIGDEDTDFIEFQSELASNIIPDTNNAYTLGSDPDTGGKAWADIYTDTLFANAIDTSAIIVDQIDLNLRQGNIFYIAENGDDAHSGTHPQDPYASLKYALSQASDGDTIHVYPGVYTEAFPMTVPEGVTIKGHAIRSVFIQPSVATQDKDAFLLNGQCTIEELSVGNFYYNSDDDTGYAFKFAPGMTVTSRSPYIRNVTVLTKGSTADPLDASDPRGFNAGDAGKGAYLDGSVVDPSSREAACLFHAVTFITPGVDSVTFTNGVRIEWLNCFTYFANRGVYCIDGTAGKSGQGTTALRVSDITGTFVAGEIISYYDTDGVTLIASGTIDNIDATGKIYVTGKQIGFETAESRTGKVVTAFGNASLDNGRKKFGTSSLALYATGDYARVAPQNDFGFSTGDFTVEAWVYIGPDSTGVGTIFDFRAATEPDTAALLQINASNQPELYVNGSTVITSGTAITAETWAHVALARDGATTTLYLNGTSVGTWADSTNYGLAKPLTIGGDYAGNNVLEGNIDDVRVIKGTAQYTTNFSVPITQLYATPETVLLLRMNGDDSSNVIEDEVVYEQDIRFSGGATATKIDLADYTDFGAEVRMIGSASVYGNYGIWGNGPGVIVYAIGQNLAYIGNGKEVTNDATTVIQENEVVELNNARVRYNSVDHRGDFRVGDLFYINQETGQVTFTAANFNVDTDTGLTFTDGVNTTVVESDRIDTGNLRISGNTIESLSGDVNFTAASDQINLNNNVNIDGNLDVTGNVTIGGNITIGDEITDSIEFVAGIASDIKPSINSEFNLGLSNRLWNNLWVESAYIDDILITDNYIQTTTSNANLELRANGAGYIVIDNLNIDNFTISSTDTDMVVAPGSEFFKVDSTGAIRLPVGTTLERPTEEAGIVRYNSTLTRFEGYDGSDWIQLHGVQDLDGDTKITAELTQGANDDVIRFDVAGTTVATLDDTKFDVIRVTVDDIEIDTNVIQTINTDTDLIFEAQGTGSVLLENFGFRENTITNTVADSVTTFVNTNNGYVKIAGSNGFVLPVGTSLNRPDPAFTEVGMLRFNTADGRVEAYDGAQWGSVAGATGSITRVDAEEIAIVTALIIG